MKENKYQPKAIQRKKVKAEKPIATKPMVDPAKLLGHPPHGRQKKS